jgi:hypothetical protein
MRWLQSARAGTRQRAAGPFFRSRTRFSVSLSHAYRLFIISRPRVEGEKKAELPARSCPILPDINNVKSKKEQGGHDRK